MAAITTDKKYEKMEEHSQKEAHRGRLVVVQLTRSIALARCWVIPCSRFPTPSSGHCGQTRCEITYDDYEEVCQSTTTTYRPACRTRARSGFSPQYHLPLSFSGDYYCYRERDAVAPTSPRISSLWPMIRCCRFLSLSLLLCHSLTHSLTPS